MNFIPLSFPLPPFCYITSNVICLNILMILMDCSAFEVPDCACEYCTIPVLPKVQLRFQSTLSATQKRISAR